MQNLKSALCVLGLTVWAAIPAPAATEGKVIDKDGVATGRNSFTVEGLVKTAEINYFDFAGNRCIPHWYADRGWCIGMTKQGSFTVVIGDGENRAYATWGHLNSPWDPGEWNHVAFTRDAETETLTLFINGEKGKCKTSRIQGTRAAKGPFSLDITSKGKLKSGGTDGMCASPFRGEIGDFTVTAGVLPDATIAEHAKAALAGFTKDGSLPLVPVPVTVVPAVESAPVPLEVVPQPKEMTVSSEVVAIPDRWEAEGLDAAGTAVLRMSLALGCGMTNLPGGVRFTFKDVPADAADWRSEQYVAHGGVTADGGYAITVTARPRERFAAIDTVAQIIRIASLGNGKRLSAPKAFAVTDWPTMRVRVALAPYFGGTREELEKSAQALALTRMSAMQLARVVDQEPVPARKLYSEVMGEYGMSLVGNLSYNYAKIPYSPLDAESMEDLRQLVKRHGDGGVRGFVMSFDDLAGKYLAVANRPAEKAKYGSIGGLHNAVVEKVREFAKSYPIDIWLATPMEYTVRNQTDALPKGGGAYFRDFTKGFREKGVTMFHTGFSKPAVDQLTAAGAETYGWYVNGTWQTKFFFSWYMGPERLAWSWYLFYVDRNGIGPVPYEDMLEELKTLGDRAPAMYVGAGGRISQYIAGWFGWNPAGWDETRANRAIAQRMYGSGVYEPLDCFSRAIAPMVGYFMAYKSGAESSEPDNVRTTPLTKSEFLGYWRNLNQAKAARRRVAAAFASQTTAFDRPLSAPKSSAATQAAVLKDMDATIVAVEAKLRSLAKRKGIVIE